MGMNLMAESSLFPNGNIPIGSFVKLDTTEGFGVVCGSNDVPFGVAGLETHIPPIVIQGVNLDDGYAGIAGGPAIKIYGVGSTMVPLRISTTVSIGDRLVPDASGYGTTTTSDKIHIGAVARQAGTTGQIINVDLVRFDSSV